MPSRHLAVITFIDGPDGMYPDNSLPGGGYIDNSLPRPGRPVDPGYGRPSIPGSIGTLPVFPFDPSVGIDNTLPGGGGGTVTPPIQLHPGLKLVVKWVACIGFVAVPDNELPGTATPR